MKKIILKNFLAFGIIAAVLFFATPVLAQIDTGVANIQAGGINLSQTNPLTVAARVINIFLSVLGVIAIGLILYAGYIIMTSGGNPEKIKVGQLILKNAVIGLIIILCSWGIVTLIMRVLIGDKNGTGSNIGTGPGFSNPGGYSALGACTVESVYPEPEQTDVSRNTAIMTTFRDPINKETYPCFNDKTKICSLAVGSDGTACIYNAATCNKINPNVIKIYTGTWDIGTSFKNATISFSSDNKTMIIIPQTYLGNDATPTKYSVYLTEDIRKEGVDFEQMFGKCEPNKYLEWGFEVSIKIDLTPPKIAEVLPAPDGQQDTVTTTTPLEATGSFTVLELPQTDKPATISAEPTGQSSAISITISPSYNDNSTKFRVIIPAQGQGKAQLIDVSDNNKTIGVSEITNNQVNFSGHNKPISIKFSKEPAVGEAWDITIEPKKIADTIKVGSDDYYFATASSSGFMIQKRNDLNAQAIEIALALSNRTDINSTKNSSDDTKIDIRAQNVGIGGNGLILTSSDPDKISVVSMHGGADGGKTIALKGAADQPMNSLIQITFSEAVMPIAISGTSEQVKDTIRVLNNNGAGNDEDDCTTNGNSDNSKCKSYNCDATSKKCVGDYVTGNFKLSNGYRTLEFTSNKECGMNGCGGKIYCLPPSSNLKVEIMAADLQSCSANTDCAVKAPYTVCQDSETINTVKLPYKICQDDKNKNHPTKSTDANTGVVDTALNSLDGNKDGQADGPIAYYDGLTKDSKYKDNFRWSFFISDEIIATPPEILSIEPGKISIKNLNQPINITFNHVMAASTMKTGSVLINNGAKNVEHKLLNLQSTDGTGYWIISSNQATTPDGNLDSTKAEIKHSPLNEMLTYTPIIGSGVTDIYQNCFKPSKSTRSDVLDGGCKDVDALNNPSCCNGIPGASCE